ncbi:MAG TPA: hypothetical protein VKQ72_01350 [Aggregatilineales bacterium]|nr:hypothetical protein [Aggregatilineales bacterium]
MSDVPSTNVQNQEQPKDRSLGARRIVAFVISFALGAAVVAAVIIFYLKAPLDAGFAIAFINDVPLWPLATLPMGLFFLIWVDYFMGTGIVVD